MCSVRPVGNWFSSSTPPISITRSSRLSRPVVSVSKMISRIRVSVAGCELVDDGLHLAPGDVETVAGIDDVVGAFTLFAVRHLTRKDHRKLFLGHSWALQRPLALQLGRTGHDDDA